MPPIRFLLLVILPCIISSCSFPGSPYSHNIGSAVAAHAASTSAMSATTNVTRNNFWGGAQ